MTKIYDTEGKVIFEGEGTRSEILVRLAQENDPGKCLTFINADLKGLHIEGADLQHINLDHADLRGGCFFRTNLTDSSFAGARLDNCSFCGSVMHKVDLSGASLFRAILRRVDLERADLSKANLSNSNLEGAFLGRANLSSADFTGANLLGANLLGANFTGACLMETILSPFSTLCLVAIEAPGKIIINHESYTIEEWDRQLSERNFDLVTLSHYRACKAYLQACKELRKSTGVSRFERIR